MKTIKTVHIVFKTHLDIGFTELARNVLDTYDHQFIPKAIELAEQMNGDFIWTTGSWLIYRYLKTASPEQREKMEEAIRKGYIVWHGLPFTTHTEAVEEKLFEYGLSIGKKLDERFGKHTISSKMTDVPGHTITIVSKLAQSGIQYLHLGVNHGSKMPEVPPVFVWKGLDGSDIIVNYHNTYGADLTVEGLEDALVFAHTGDNYGPPSIEDIQNLYQELQNKYPGARVKASTLDEFAAQLLPIKDQLPIVYEEIGDSWIHGIASDPLRISQYRELLRLRDRWFEEGRLSVDSEEYETFSEALLLIPEHTWGLDIKRFLPDFVNYAKKDFQKARETNLIATPLIPETYAYVGKHALKEADEKRSYRYFESSWEEQSAFIDQAIQALSADKQQEAIQVLASLQPKEIASFEEQLRPYETYRLGEFSVSFAEDGSIVSLIDVKGKVWADETNRLGAFHYQTYGLTDYNTWYEEYHVKMEQNQNWVVGDFGKPGFEYSSPKPERRTYTPYIQTISVLREDQADVVRVELRMSSKATEVNGAPRILYVEYRLYKGESRIDITLNWLQKDANRLPESSWFSFVPKVDSPNMWKIDKLGEWISPLTVVKGGNRNMHAGETGVHYHGADGIVHIESLDAPLVSFGEPRLLRFDNTSADLRGGIHYNLHNNVWGTNFRMWFEEDMKFRFSLTFKSYRD